MGQPVHHGRKFPRNTTDVFSLIALRRGLIQVDRETGAITNQHGKRVEQLRPDGGGRVRVQRHPRSVWAPAHRIVYLAIHGPIPARYFVRHRNGLKWDNRPENLELTRRRGFVTYPLEADDGCSQRESSGTD